MESYLVVYVQRPLQKAEPNGDDIQDEDWSFARSRRGEEEKRVSRFNVASMRSRVLNDVFSAATAEIKKNG